MKIIEIINKIKLTIENLIAPIIAIAFIWFSVDITLYVSVFGSAIIGILTYIEEIIEVCKKK